MYITVQLVGNVFLYLNINLISTQLEIQKRQTNLNKPFSTEETDKFKQAFYFIIIIEEEKREVNYQSRLHSLHSFQSYFQL